MWTYSGNPAASDRDAVRFHMQDTRKDEPLYQDEEIDYLLTLHGSVIPAAIAGLRNLLTRYAQNPDIRMGQTWIFDSDRVPLLRQALAELQSLRRGTPYSGGLAQSEFDALDDSTETDTLPAFRRDPTWAKAE